MAKKDFRAIIRVIRKVRIMKKINDIDLFSSFGIILVSFGWMAVFLAVLSLFTKGFLVGASLIAVVTLGYAIFLFQRHSRPSLDFSLVLIFSLFAVMLFSHFTVPTVFSGRDQGSLSNAAISLSENHSLKSSFPAEKQFFQIYGPGQALNFPGFYYTKDGSLISQFSLGYVAWLAAFFTLFGLSGLIVANAFSFFLFLLSFYVVSRNYLEKKAALIAFLLVGTSFVFSWFFKFTLTENLALGLLWFGLAQFLLFWEKETRINLFACILSFGLLLFVRIEALAFLSVIALLFFLKYKHKKQQFKKIFIQKEIIILFILIFIAFISSLFLNSAFYVTIAKGFLSSLSFYKHNFSGSSLPFSGTIYLLRVFSLYAILTYIALAIIALGYFLKKKNYPILLPFFILLPTFIYLLNPSISLDHPWMLRRYLFAVIPVSILYSIIFLKDFLKKNILFYVFSGFLLLTNLLIFFPFLGVKENPTLLSQIENISLDFQADDLILVDRNATGNPWAMMAGPLNVIFGKQAVYFFNPDDLKKIDLTQFKKVYLIIPDNNLDAYEKSELLKNVIIVKSYSLENFALNEIDRTKKELYKTPVTFPPYLKNYTYGKIYLLKK